jgi:hypothetical protein
MAEFTYQDYRYMRHPGGAESAVRQKRHRGYIETMPTPPAELSPLNDTPYTIAALPLDPGEVFPTLTFIAKSIDV